MENTVVAHGVCPHDCYDTCGLEVTAQDGVIRQIRGERRHPVTRGFLCFKVNHYLDRVYHPDRVLHPLRRVGAKGSGRFERISWEEAMGEIGERLRAIVIESGGEAVLPYSFAGNMGLLSRTGMDRRFFHSIGASALERTICTAAAEAALTRVYGQRLGPDPETLPYGRLILLWGTNPASTNVHELPWLDQARDAGAEVWTVDPLRTETARRYRNHLALKTNTDVALALCLGRGLIESGRHDREFLDQYAQGFERYYERARLWTLKRTVEVTGLEPRVIEALTDRLAAIRPLVIRSGFGVQRQDHGAEAVWAISALSILTGSHRDVGGGHLLSNSDAFPINKGKLEGHHLLSQGVRRVNMVELGLALTALGDPPVRALISYNSNPAATAPDQSTVLRGLAREDLLTVVHEQMMTDTARWADFVLPAAMGMESLDLHVSYWHRYVQLNQPATPPAGESVSNAEFFRRLARSMGLHGPELYASDEDLIGDALDSDHPWLDGITLESLKRNPVQKVRLDAHVRPFVDTPIQTPSGRLCLEPLPVGGFSDPEVDSDYPLYLISPSARETIKSSFGNIASVQKRRWPELLVAPEDLHWLNLAHGDWVWLESRNGRTPMVALESTVPQSGTVVSYAVRWNGQGQGTNVNQVTSARLSDMGGGATFYSVRVRLVAMAEEEIPHDEARSAPVRLCSSELGPVGPVHDNEARGG